MNHRDSPSRAVRSIVSDFEKATAPVFRHIDVPRMVSGRTGQIEIGVWAELGID